MKYIMHTTLQFLLVLIIGPCCCAAELIDGPKYNLVCTDFSKGEVLVVSNSGDIKQRFKTQQCNDVWALPNGDVLFAWRRGIKVYDKTGDAVFEWNTSVKEDEIHTCQPLPNGNILIAQNGPSRLIEINRAGKIVKEIPIETTSNNVHMRFRMCRKLPSGNYLCMLSSDNEIREINADGQTVRTIKNITDIKMVKSHAVVRLPNGNTLFTTGAGATAVEVDKDDKVVWKFEPADAPDIEMGFMTGLNRLPNGNTVLCFYQGSHHLIEVTPDKKIIWKWRMPGQQSVTSVQILDQAGDASAGTILK